MNGSTKAIASASATGITAMPDTKEKVDRIRKTARRKTKPSTRGLTAQGRPIHSTTGSIKAPCTTNRAAVIWPTGMPFSAASFDETSKSGASMQKHSMRTMPGKMRSCVIPMA